MKYILTLTWLCLTFAVQAQFKEISQNQTPGSTSHNDLKLISKVPLSSGSVAGRDNVATLKINPISTSNLLNYDRGLIHNVEKDPQGRVLSISATVFNNKRNYTLEQKLSSFLEVVKEELKIIDPKEELKAVSQTTDELGISHIRLQQYHNGVPVYGGELIVHGPEDNYDFVNGVFHSGIELSVEPSIGLEKIQQSVYAEVGQPMSLENTKLDVFDLVPEKVELVVYPYEDSFRLTYHHSIYTNLVDRWEVFIDANTGEILRKYTSICKFHNHSGSTCEGHSHGHEEEIIISKQESNSSLEILGPEKAVATDLLGVQREIDTYSVGSDFYLIDASRTQMFNTNSNMPNEPEGTIWTIDAFNSSPQNDNFRFDHVKSSNNTWSDRASVSAQYNGAKAFLYFINIHNRVSINGSGGNIISLINVADEDGRSLGNAFWNGAAMFYGNGDANFGPLAAGLDVAGHEMTHGVIQNTANLEYQGESGALNESFADIFGAMIDRDDWEIGEDVVRGSAFPSGALRSLRDPHNGAATGDFNSGWQPKRYSERFTGSQDNGGVHINSGIPNHAYYLFANDARLGSTENERKIKAERVYYRALSEYLVRSSQFVDCRVAVVKAAQDLYGDGVVAAARAAFDQVEITGENGGTYQNDTNTNPGDDLIIFTRDNQDDIFIFTADGQAIANPLTTNDPISKPSVTDAGDAIVFVGSDELVHYISIDWNEGIATESTLSFGGANQWRNAVISKDGRLLAVLEAEVNNRVLVFDLATGDGNAFELFNPTYTIGVSTGDVLFADAMEFDYSGEWLMYDANNRITSQSSGEIEYWDIGFIQVWNKNSDTFPLTVQIEKLFNGLQEGVSIGNPTFSKNSNYIIAFDFLDEGTGEFNVFGANIQTGDVGLIKESQVLGYPSYSRTDENIIMDGRISSSERRLEILGLQPSKIASNNSAVVYGDNLRWATWFSNGFRNLTSINETRTDEPRLSVYPNPTGDITVLEVIIESAQDAMIKIVGFDGKLIRSFKQSLLEGQNNIEVQLSDLNQGVYMIQLIAEDFSVNEQVVKF